MIEQAAEQACRLAGFDRGLTIGLAIGCFLALMVYAFAWLERDERKRNTITLQ